MKIEYFGHSCFLLTDGKTRIVTDPFAGIGYEMPQVAADYVTLSHDHFDHNHIGGVKGVKKVFTRAGGYTAGSVRIRGIDCWHDEVQGARRGAVVSFTFDFGGVKVCHLGDYGEKFSTERADRFGHPDILLVPVGGTYTVDARAAVRLIEAIAPKVVIPMHYSIPGCSLDSAPLADFENAFGKDRIVGPVAALDSKDVDKYIGKAVVPEVLRHG